jgi:hypothetical protein
MKTKKGAKAPLQSQTISPQKQHWTDLFDPYLRDHVVDLMRNNWLKRRIISVDDPRAVAQTIDQELLSLLCIYVSECKEKTQKSFLKEREYWAKRGIQDHPRAAPTTTNVVAAFEFMITAQALIDAWQEKRSTEKRLNELIGALETSWTNFIVEGAASRVYHDLPKEKKQRSDAAKKPRKARQIIDRVELEKHAKLLLATGKERHEIAGILAPKFGVTTKAIRNALPIGMKNNS